MTAHGRSERPAAALGERGEAFVPAALDPALAHRRASATVTVRDAAGALLPDTWVTVEQRGHAFGFGNTAFELLDLLEPALGPDDPGSADRAAALERFTALFLGVFDTATLPFYWQRFEPRRGAPDTVRLRRAAQWLVERGVRVKGHPLVWHTLAPDWLLPLDDDAVEAAIRARIARDVADMAGVVDLWDAINEVVIMPVFDKDENAVTRLASRRGRLHMVRTAFEAARAANPAARLVLNDFDLSADYEHLVEECLEAGITIDALGLQTHMHQGYRGEDAVREICDRFARFGLPLQLTETTLVSGHLMPPEIVDLNDYVVDAWPSTPEGEARQADELERHYRTLFAHPAVESVTYWGLGDEGAWLGAPAGLVRADGTPKPSYDALRSLVRGEWWLAPTTVRTDASGRLDLTTFAGTFAVRGSEGAGTAALAAGASTVEVTLAG